MSRDFVDNAVYADFAEGEEAALTITLQRGANTALPAVALAKAGSLTLPRILYTRDNLGLPGSHERRIRERIQFVALGSLDGETPPITLA